MFPSTHPKSDLSVQDRLSSIPSVHEILNDPEFVAACGDLSCEVRTRLIRRSLRLHREEIARDARARVEKRHRTAISMCIAAAEFIQQEFPKRVINGTGVLLHTNLGRSPLGHTSVAMGGTGLEGYSSIEWDPFTQERGDRCLPLEVRLQMLTGAEGAVIVNNCAGALLLALSEIARDRQVLVSRSELVEIGGGFRIPEIISLSGCSLVEVGTTNKTRLSDYAKRMNSESVILKVHQSNFYQCGFVEHVRAKELVRLGRQHGVPVIEDNGSGLVVNSDDISLSNIPSVLESVSEGIDVVCFSADKLFGSVQAGIIVGKNSVLSRMRKHPLYRVLRLDKGRIASLHKVLGEYLADRSEALPLWRMRKRSVEELRSIIDKLDLTQYRSEKFSINVVDLQGTFGGGSNPDQSFLSAGVELHHDDYSCDGLRRYFGARAIPIVGYIKKDRFIIDIRTFFDADFVELKAALSDLGNKK